MEEAARDAASSIWRLQLPRRLCLL